MNPTNMNFFQAANNRYTHARYRLKSMLVMLSLMIGLSVSANAQQTDPVCLYSQVNYQGQAFCSDTNVSFVPLRFSTKSIKILPGYHVAAHRYPLFFGEPKTITSSLSNSASLLTGVGSFKLIERPEEARKNVIITPIIKLLLLDDGDPNDYDGDGYSNDLEDTYGTDPRDPNSTPPDIDGDKIPDDIDDDRDGDGVSNLIEEERGTNPDIASDYPDLVAPILSVNNPNDIQTQADKIIVSGTLIEPQQPYSGLKEFYLSSSMFSGTKFTIAANDVTGQFSLEVPLKIGANVITLTALDQSANQANVVINIKRVFVPTIESISPANSTVVSVNSTRLNGTIRSLIPNSDFRMFVNNSVVTTQSTNQADIFTFNIDNVPLELGDNRFEFRVSSDDGADQQSIIVRYVPDAADELSVPVINNISPSNERFVNQNSFKVGAQIESFAGPLTVLVNDLEVLNQSEGLSFYVLNELLSFADNNNRAVLTIQAIDSLGRQTEQTIEYTRDLQKPVIQFDPPVQAGANVSIIKESPFTISGTVSDNNLSSFLVNEQSLELIPGDVIGEYKFTLRAPVNGDTPSNFNFAAYDRSGNVTRSEVALLNTASATLKAILPPEGSVFLSKDNAAINVQVAARQSGLETSQSVVAYVQSAPQQPVQLSVNGTLASGDLSLAGNAGKQRIIFEVRDPQNQVVSSTALNVEVQAAEDIALEVVRTEPANNQNLVEPNAPIEIYFNQAIDINNIRVTVNETLHGKSYVNADELGEDFIRAQGYVLSDISRDRELVSGQLTAIPGNAGVVFAPNRNFAYNADLFVSVNNGDDVISRTRFKVRELPTFINGAVVDQFGQPLSGILVELPELNRRTTTNGDGGFAFGYQEAANKVIKSGRYTLLVNPDFKNTKFGTANIDVSVQQHRMNSVNRITLQELDSAIAFSSIVSGQNNVLLGGDLTVDLSAPATRVIFPNSRTSGPAHAQFLPFEHLGVQTYASAMPLWLFGVQPKGIAVEGNAKVSIKVPMLRGGSAYIEGTQHVVMLGFTQQGQVVEPIGVGQLVNGYVHSQGKLHLSSLDYIGYAQVNAQLNSTLNRYANGELSLVQLKAALQGAANDASGG